MKKTIEHENLYSFVEAYAKSINAKNRNWKHQQTGGIMAYFETQDAYHILFIHRT